MPNVGMEMNSIITDTRIDQVNSGICIQPIPGARIVAIVTMKLIPVKVDEATSRTCPPSQKVAP